MNVLQRISNSFLCSFKFEEIIYNTYKKERISFKDMKASINVTTCIHISEGKTHTCSAKYNSV